MKGENDLKGFHLNSVQLVLFLLLMASMQAKHAKPEAKGALHSKLKML